MSMLVKIVNIATNNMSIWAIASSVAAIVSAIGVTRQCNLQRKEFEENMKARSDLIRSEKTLKATEITGFFKDQVLDKLPIIKTFHNFLEISETLKNVDANRMKKFDYGELRGIFSQEDIDMISGKLCSKELPEIAKKINIIFNYCLIGNSEITIESESEGQRDFLLDAIYTTAFKKLTAQIMNNIEYFAMYYINDSAYEEITYRSWHGLYLETMKTLYYEICLANQPDYEDKICVNAIALYNKWNERANQERAKQQSSC